MEVHTLGPSRGR